MLYNLRIINNLYLSNILQQLFQMQPIDQTNFIVQQLFNESLSAQNLPFYIVYLNPSPISNNHYSNYFHTSNRTFQNVAIDTQNHKIPTDSLSQEPLQSQTKPGSTQQINASQNNDQASSPKYSSERRTKKQKARVPAKQFSDQDYSPREESSFEVRSHKLSETKNIPKNYEKAILLFINKNISYTYKVLQHCNVDFQAFMGCLQKNKKDLGSIAKLRSLWLDSENPYAKVFRIISKEYLRKHALSYIFNSRVVNITKHVKYRHIIQQSISNPQCFTHIKQY